MIPQNNTTTLTVAATPSHVENTHRREDTFQMYILWKALPAVFKAPPRDKKSGMVMPIEEFLEMMGVTDEKVITLSKIRWQQDFAKRFEISIDTLTDWNKEIAERDPLSDIRMWAAPLAKNVINSLYNNALRKGMSFEVKLFMQLINGWSEKSVVEHDYKGVKSITYEIIDTKKPDETTISDQKENQPSPESGS